MLSPKAFAAFALSSLILLSHPIIADDSQLSADSIARLGKIIGGTPVSSRDYPWIVALETATMQDWGGYQFCGGTLIAPNKVLTAAHCSNELPNKSLRVRVGSNQVDTGGTLFKVKTQAVHPKYNKSTSDYDVAVWTLDKPVILSDDINLIELPVKSR